MRLSLSKIHEAAANRPPGYFEDVLSHGEVSGDWLEISPHALAELRQKYRPVMHEPALPSLPEMARNAALAAKAEVSALARRMPAVSDAVVLDRLAICAACDRWRESDNRCSACGCFTQFKARLRSSSCPLGKW